MTKIKTKQNKNILALMLVPKLDLGSVLDTDNWLRSYTRGRGWVITPSPPVCNRGDTILHHGGLHTDLNQCNQGSLAKIIPRPLIPTALLRQQRLDVRYQQ